MSLAHKFNAWVGWSEESTFGTPITATKFLEIESEALKFERKQNVVPLLGHVSQRRTVKSKTNVSGTIRAPVLWEGMEQWLKHAFGSVITTGPAAAVYTHTYSLAANLPTGLTIEVNRDDAAISGNGAYQYAGCKINKLTLTQEMEQPLMMEAEIIGRDRALIAATSKTFPTYDAIDYAQMTVMATDPGGLAEYTLKCKSLKIIIDNALYEDQFRLGSPLRAGITRGSQRKVTVEAEIEYEDLTIMALYNSMGLDGMRFKWVNSTKSLQFDFPSVTFDGEEPQSDDQGPYYMTMTNTSLANAADNDELVGVLINATVSV